MVMLEFRFQGLTLDPKILCNDALGLPSLIPYVLKCLDKSYTSSPSPNPRILESDVQETLELLAGGRGWGPTAKCASISEQNKHASYW